MKPVWDRIREGALGIIVLTLLAMGCGLGLRLAVWAFKIGWNTIP